MLIRYYDLGFTNLDGEDAPLVQDVFLEPVQGDTGVRAKEFR